MKRYESRGVRCLECKGLDLKASPEQARGGFGRCATVPARGYVAFDMSRNCLEFDRAPDDVVGPRDKWNEGRRMFWQK